MANLVIKNNNNNNTNNGSALSFRENNKDDVRFIVKDDKIIIKKQSSDMTNYDDQFEGDNFIPLQLGYGWSDGASYDGYLSKSNYLRLNSTSIIGESGYSWIDGEGLRGSRFRVGTSGFKIWENEKSVLILDRYGLTFPNDSTFDIWGGTLNFYCNQPVFHNTVKMATGGTQLILQGNAASSSARIEFNNGSVRTWIIQSPGTNTDDSNRSNEFQIRNKNNSVLFSINQQGGFGFGGNTSAAYTGFRVFKDAYFKNKVEINNFLSVGCTDLDVEYGAAAAAVQIISEGDTATGLYFGHNGNAERMIRFHPSTYNSSSNKNQNALSVVDLTFEGGANIALLKSSNEVIFDGIYGSYNIEKDEISPYDGTGFYVLGLGPKSSYTWNDVINPNKEMIKKIANGETGWTNNEPSCFDLTAATMKLYPVLTSGNAHLYTLSLERGGVVDGKVIFNKKIEVPGVTCLSDSSSYFRYLRINKKAVVGTSAYEPINANYSLSIHGKDSLYIENIVDIGAQKPDNITRYSNRAILNVVSSTDIPCDFYLGSNGKGIWDFSVREVKDNNMLVLYNPIKGGYAAIINMLNDDTAKYEFTLQGRLIVGGATQLNSTLTVGTGDNNKDTKLNGKLAVTDKSTLKDTEVTTFKATGKSTLGELSAGATALSGTLTVGTTTSNKATTLNGTLKVTDTTTLAALTAASATLTGALTVGGNSSLKKTDITGNLGITGTLTVNGTNATSLGGALTVTGATTLSSTLDVTGATTLKNGLTVSNSKATSLTGTLNVTGNTTLSSNLTVNGNATFSKSLNANSGIMVSDSAEFNCESFIIKNSNKNIFNIESNEITIRVPLNVTASANNEQAMLNLINTVSNATCELKMGANSTALWGIRVRDDKADDGETEQQAHLGFGIYNHSTKRTNLLITPGGTTFFNGNVCFNDQILLTTDSYGTGDPSTKIGNAAKTGMIYFKIIN